MKPGHRKRTIIFGAIVALAASGCTTHYYSQLTDQPRAEVLEPIRTVFPVEPVKVQVLDFVVNSVQSAAGNVTAEAIKTNYSLAVPNALYRSLGARHAFAEVSRAARAGGSADYYVSGSFDYAFRGERSLASYFMYPAMLTVSVKGTTHLKVTEAKTGTVIFEKTYIEQHADSGLDDEMLSVHLLHPAEVETMTLDIKKAILSGTGQFRG